MTSFVDVFERKEIKYRIDAQQRADIQQSLDGHMVEDQYAHTHIISTYFDTANRDLIARSLEKPLYKEKLRLRSYGEPAADSQVFVELKKKFKGIVYKRRVSLSYQAALAWLSGTPYALACNSYPLADELMQGESFTDTSMQIAREIDAFRSIYPHLAPSMSIVVDRYSLASIPSDLEPPVRVTFDSQIRYIDHFDSSATASSGKLLIGEEESIMELKVQGAFPLWLTEVLSQAHTLPSSFSKYGEAYRLSEANLKAYRGKHALRSA